MQRRENGDVCISLSSNFSYAYGPEVYFNLCLPASHLGPGIRKIVESILGGLWDSSKKILLHFFDSGARVASPALAFATFALLGLATYP